MKAQRARRFFAVSAIGVLMAGGAAIGAAGTASAAAPAQAQTHVTNGCSNWGGRGFGNCGFGFNNGFNTGFNRFGFNSGFGFNNGFNNGFGGGVVVIVVP